MLSAMLTPVGKEVVLNVLVLRRFFVMPLPTGSEGIMFSSRPSLHSLTPISSDLREGISLKLARYSSSESGALLKRLSTSEVKGQGHEQTNLLVMIWRRHSFPRCGVEAPQCFSFVT